MGVSHENLLCSLCISKVAPTSVSLIGVTNYILLVFMSFTRASFFIMCVYHGGGGVLDTQPKVCKEC